MKRKMIVIILCIFIVACGVFYNSTANKTIGWKNAQPGTVLVDYYSGISGTDGYDSYYELILKMTNSADTVILEEYSTNAGTEQSFQYVVSAEVVDKCYEIINEQKMYAWNDKYSENPSTGGGTVCRFFDGNKMIRVSTDCMPKDGGRILSEIKSQILSYKP